MQGGFEFYSIKNVTFCNAEKNSLTVHSAIDVICAVVHKYTSQVVLKLDLQVFSKLIEARFD